MIFWKKRMNISKKIPHPIWALLMTLLIECTLFQYEFYGSLWNEPDNAPELVICSGEQWNLDGSITAGEDLLLQIANINKVVHSLQIGFRRYTEDGVLVTDGTSVVLQVTDQANADYFPLRNRIIFSENADSQYIRLHLSGESGNMLLYFEDLKGDTLYLDNIVINPHFPFSFSVLRCILLFGTLIFVIYTRPQKQREMALFEEEKIHKWVTLTVVAIQLVIFCSAVFMNPAIYNPQAKNHAQYHELAVALSKGHLYLDEMPPQELIEMGNPYDYDMREKILSEAEGDYIWDCAYFNGRYYVYFGVLPVVIFYLPWYLITGTAFPTWLGIMITGVAFVLIAYSLSRAIVKKYFDGKIPYVIWLLTTVLAVNGCGVIMVMRRPDLYYFPILCGVTLSLGGIHFWISSLKQNGVCTWQLLAGCLCMALVAACRPQLLVGSLLIFPIYWDAVFKKRWLFSRKGLWKTILACLTYIIVAGLLMLYNYKRFGSPFDFGANYNLTFNDMTKRGMVLARIPLAIFISLFQTPNICAEFPYLDGVNQWTSYMGKTIRETTFGGFFIVNLLPLAGTFFLNKRHWFARKGIWASAIITFVLGFFIVCIDAQVAGILLRYYVDFGWLFYLSAVLVWFSVWQHNIHNQERVHLLQIATNVFFCIGMAYAFLILFVDTTNSLVNENPALFYKFYHQLAFWA